MRPSRWLILTLFFVITSCQTRSPGVITILDNGQTHHLQTNERVPLLILTQAGLTVTPGDRVLINGTAIPLDQPAAIAGPFTLQIRRALELTLATPQGQQTFISSALTVGQALAEAGFQLYASDFVDPRLSTVITKPMTITYVPARELSIVEDDEIIPVRSAAGTVGEVLAGAGIPLIGLDYSLPSENEAPPDSGEIRIVRVHESVIVESKSIPFSIEYIQSPDVELGSQQVMEPGQNGLAITRTRIRYEDGKEVSRVEEEESVVTLPKAEVVKTGIMAVINTITTGGETLQYWRAYEMYATIYSPCNSGTGGCSYGTASGLRAGRGVVAVDRSMYSWLQGQRLYIPGYGYAVIGDIGGGSIIEQNLGVPRHQWIDLGFDDNNIVDMSGWMTVYFLAPVPAAIPPFMQ